MKLWNNIGATSRTVELSRDQPLKQNSVRNVLNALIVTSRSATTVNSKDTSASTLERGRSNAKKKDAGRLSHETKSLPGTRGYILVSDLSRVLTAGKLLEEKTTSKSTQGPIYHNIRKSLLSFTFTLLFMDINQFNVIYSPFNFKMLNNSVIKFHFFKLYNQLFKQPSTKLFPEQNYKNFSFGKLV